MKASGGAIKFSTSAGNKRKDGNWIDHLTFKNRLCSNYQMYRAFHKSMPVKVASVNTNDALTSKGTGLNNLFVAGYMQ